MSVLKDEFAVDIISYRMLQAFVVGVDWREPRRLAAEGPPSADCLTFCIDCVAVGRFEGLDKKAADADARSAGAAGAGAGGGGGGAAGCGAAAAAGAVPFCFVALGLGFGCFAIKL